MHVAHFIHRFPPALGGAESYFARLSNYLDHEGDSVRVYTSNALDLTAFWSWSGRTLPRGLSAGQSVMVERFRCWRWPGRRYVLWPLALVPHRLWQCLTLPCNPLCPGMWRAAGRFDGPLDVVHATAFPYAFPIACARRLARRRGVPLAVTPFLHLGDPADAGNAVRRAYLAPALAWLLRQADLIFTQTPSEQRAVLDLGIATEKVVLQGLGVDFGECTGGQREAARARLGIAADECVAGLLANHSVEKGSVDLLQAARQLWQSGRKLRVLLGGPEMPNFLSFWRNFAPAAPPHAVERLGPLDAQAKKDFFAALDFFVLPSRSDSFGLVLLEAWANAKPVVGYRAGGVADVIRHGVDGLLVPCGDIAELARTMDVLSQDAGRRAEMGQSGQARAARDFRWDDKLALVRAACQRASAEFRKKGPVAGR